jgi:hypothetical protein
VTWGFEKARASSLKETFPLSQITQIKGFFMSYRDEANKYNVYLPRTRQQGKKGHFPSIKMIVSAS